MATPLRPKTPVTRIKENMAGVAAERRKPLLPGPYIFVSGGDGQTSAKETWQSPEWKHSFDYVLGRDVGFRHGLDGDVEFIGQLDLTVGAVTGTVCFTLPTPWTAISFEFPFPIYIGGGDWINGIFSVDGTPGPTQGDCTVYWPVQATAI